MTENLFARSVKQFQQTDTHGVGSYSRSVFLLWACSSWPIFPLYLVPLAIGVALLQSSLYDVPGGFKAVMFDRFSGVKDQVWFQFLSIWNAGELKDGAQATGEGTHFLVPWLQRAILYDCRIKPRVSSLQLETVRRV